jgi:hypothetical protein
MNNILSSRLKSETNLSEINKYCFHWFKYLDTAIKSTTRLLLWYDQLQIIDVFLSGCCISCLYLEESWISFLSRCTKSTNAEYFSVGWRAASLFCYSCRFSILHSNLPLLSFSLCTLERVFRSWRKEYIDHRIYQQLDGLCTSSYFFWVTLRFQYRKGKVHDDMITLLDSIASGVKNQDVVNTLITNMSADTRLYISPIASKRNLRLVILFKLQDTFLNKPLFFSWCEDQTSRV